MIKLKPCQFCGVEMELKPILMCDAKTTRYEPRPKHYLHKRGCQLEFAAFSGSKQMEQEGNR